MAKRACIYARVSTGGQSPQMQLDVLREFASRRGFEVVAEYVDHGVSGTKVRRPELDRLMEASRKRQHDVVLVFRFDRMARSTTHLLRVLEEFDGLGIDFISYSENLDTSTPMGKAMFTIMGALAQLERDIIVERSVEGQRRARARGKHVGRPRVKVDADLVHGLRNRGVSIREIARLVGVGKNVVMRVLSERAA